jgi:hypothetical protein
MDFMAPTTNRPGLTREYIETTGAVLASRNGFDSAIGDSRPYGGEWKGPIFVLTHHREDAPRTATSHSSPARSKRRCGSASRPLAGRT